MLSRYTWRIKNRKKILLCTNPVERLSKEFGTTPIGTRLDMARLMTDRHDGSWIIEKKGYTNWGCATEVIKYLEKRKRKR